MTVFVFPFLHRRLPENLFLRLCESHPTREVAVTPAWAVSLTEGDRSTRVSRCGLILPFRMVLQLYLIDLTPA